LWDKRFDEILRDIGVFVVFLFFVYFIAFSNLSDSSFIYNELFQSTFIQAQSPNETGLEKVFGFKLIFLGEFITKINDNFKLNDSKLNFENSRKLLKKIKLKDWIELYFLIHIAQIQLFNALLQIKF
jgi:hypothetical protein